MTVWKKVESESPCVSSLGGKKILVLVNGEIHLCTILKRPGPYGSLDFYPVADNFLYCEKQGWCGDPRFAAPTHWMAFPDPPEN